MTLEILSLISPEWAVMFQDSNLTVFIFRDLLDFVVLFFRFHYKIFKSIHNNWLYRVTDITSFGERLRRSSRHTWNFSQNMMRICFKRNPSHSLLRLSILQTKEDQRHNKAKSHIALNPSRRCLTCGAKWTFCRTGPKNLCMS